MTINPIVRARIQQQIKEEASVVLKAMGLTVSDAFRMLLTKVAREKKMPFEPFVPNATTLAAIAAVRRGETTKVIGGVNNLLKSLNEND